nr:hypothetical protein [Tanacetum cinerariifolium]
MGFGCMLDFPFQKIPEKMPYFVLKNLDTVKMEVSLPTSSKIKITPKKWEVLGILMRNKKLESDSLREYDDEFLKEFKEQFKFKKFITTTDLSKLIQKTTTTDFMFQVNYLMLFANCMINCDNSSRLKYFVIKNIKSEDIISDFNWCEFIWNHIRTSKLIYLHYTKFDGMVTMRRKWPAIKNWTNQDVSDREILEMNGGEFAKFQTILKEKKELEDLLKENIELDELYNGDEKNRKKCCRDKAANKAREMRKKAVENKAAEKEATAKEKEEAEKLAEAKKKEQTEKLAVAKKKEQAEKLVATKKKQEAEKLATTKKEQAEMLATTKKKEESEKKAAAEKEVAAKKKEKAEKKAAVEKEKAEKEAVAKKEKAEKKDATKENEEAKKKKNH